MEDKILELIKQISPGPIEEASMVEEEIYREIEARCWCLFRGENFVEVQSIDDEGYYVVYLDPDIAPTPTHSRELRWEIRGNELTSDRNVLKQYRPNNCCLVIRVLQDGSAVANLFKGIRKVSSGLQATEELAELAVIVTAWKKGWYKNG